VPYAPRSRCGERSSDKSMYPGSLLEVFIGSWHHLPCTGIPSPAVNDRSISVSPSFSIQLSLVDSRPFSKVSLRVWFRRIDTKRWWNVACDNLSVENISISVLIGIHDGTGSLLELFLSRPANKFQE